MKQAMITLIGLAALTIAMAATAQDDAITSDTIDAEDNFDREGERCINTSRIQETHATDDQTILFYMRGGDIYRNALRRECRGLERENAFSYRVTANRLCGTDTISVLRRFAGSLEEGSRCGLGQFYPITEGEADFLRYGERSEMQEEPEAVELPDSEETEEVYQDSSYGIDEYNSETDYNFEC